MSDENCQSMSECERSCTKRQRIVECTWEYFECINVSYTVINETTQQRMFMFQRTCGPNKNDCETDYHCVVAYHFNSTNCKVRWSS